MTLQPISAQDCLLFGIDSLYVSYPFNTRGHLIDFEDLAVRKLALKSDGKSEAEEITLLVRE